MPVGEMIGLGGRGRARRWASLRSLRGSNLWEGRGRGACIARGGQEEELDGGEWTTMVDEEDKKEERMI